MATARRKERRQKELIKAGRGVMKIITERDSALSKIESESAVIDRLRLEKSDLSKKLGKLGNDISEIKNIRDGMAGDLNAKKIQIGKLEDKICQDGVLLKAWRAKATKFERELATIQKEDRDSFKLRRRVHEAKNKISELNTEVCRLKRREVEA